MHEIPVYDVFSIDHVPALGRTYYWLIHSPNLKIGGTTMHHTFEYGDVLEHQNLDKLTKNYEAFEKTIKELEKELAIYRMAEKYFPEVKFLVFQCRPESKHPKYRNR